MHIPHAPTVAVWGTYWHDNDKKVYNPAIFCQIGYLTASVSLPAAAADA